MILMSPIPSIVQSTPVTTTYDADGRSETPSSPGRRRRIDWKRVERLYAFCRARASERIGDAERHDDSVIASKERHCLRILERLYAQSHHRNDVVAECAVTYFRARAMRDAQHPEFLGEWISSVR